MTAKTQVEHVVDARHLAAPPTVGIYFASPSGAVTVLLVTRVTRIAAGGSTAAYRLYCLRLRRSALPDEVTVLPWPRERRPVGRPSRAAEAPAPSDRPAIVTRQQKQKAQRDKVIALRRSYADPDNAQIEPARRNKVRPAEWRDPSDTDVLRRSPRTVSGFRATDVLESLQSSGTLNRQQVGAAKRLRRDWEIGTQMTAGAVDWERGGVSVSGTPVGVSERTLQFLERYQAAQAAVGRLFEIVDYVCLQGGLLKDYAAQQGINPANAAGRLFAAIEVLQGHYDALDESATRRRSVHTIGALQENDDGGLVDDWLVDARHKAEVAGEKWTMTAGTCMGISMSRGFLCRTPFFNRAHSQGAARLRRERRGRDQQPVRETDRERDHRIDGDKV
jgi:hypothetical protein